MPWDFIQQFGQWLLDKFGSITDPLLAQLYVVLYGAFYGVQYDILAALAGFVWWFDKLLIMLGLMVSLITTFLEAKVFVPMIQDVTGFTSFSVNAAFVIALLL